MPIWPRLALRDVHIRIQRAHRPPPWLRRKRNPQRLQLRGGEVSDIDAKAAPTSAGSDVRIWGTLSDISQDGCYIEMTATFPVATIANLVLEANGIRLRVKGRVQVSYPFLGMGMRFSEVSEEQRAPLQELLDSLSKPAAPHP